MTRRLAAGLTSYFNGATAAGAMVFSELADAPVAMLAAMIPAVTAAATRRQRLRGLVDFILFWV
jgi:hypothetical protein